MESADRRGKLSEHNEKPTARTGRGTDQDLPLKIAMRRLLWRMGCSTRLDVRLRAYVPAARGQSPAQDLTDLDVLGVGFTPGGQLHTSFADCRSTEKRAMERMFWVRGVADFVRADEALLVRAHQVPPAVRTLSSRLGIGVVTPQDFTAMEAAFPTELNLTDGPLGCLFDIDAVATHLDAHSNGDRKLRKLTEYLEFDYWVYEPHRNLSQLIARLTDVVPTLDPSNPLHRTLFYDCAWHYALAVARAVGFIRTTRMSDVPTAVRMYVAGGELALKEKTALVELLAQNGWPAESSLALPHYVDGLTDLITRFLIRPTELADVLRYGEYLAVSEANRVSATVKDAFGEQTRAIAAKLFADICGFLVTNSGLRPEFRTSARARLVFDLTGGVSEHAEAREGAPAASHKAQPTSSKSEASPPKETLGQGLLDVEDVSGPVGTSTPAQ